MKSIQNLCAALFGLLLPLIWCHQNQGYGNMGQQPPQQQVPHMGMPQQGSQGGIPGQQTTFGHQHGMGQQQQGMQQQGGIPNQNLIRDKAHIQDREHIKEHLLGVVDHPDVAKMSEEELQFHYFKMHDNDDNNKLDGCELIKSLIHWHVEESKHISSNPQDAQGQPGQGQAQAQGHQHGHAQGVPPPTPGSTGSPHEAGLGTTKIFTDSELAMMIDPILDMDDRNRDGFIDYPEFVAAQQSRGF